MYYMIHRLIASHIKSVDPPTTGSPVATVKLECAYTNRHAIHAHVSGFLALYCAAFDVYSLITYLYLQRPIMILMSFLFYRLLIIDCFLIKISLA